MRRRLKTENSTEHLGVPQKLLSMELTEFQRKNSPSEDSQDMDMVSSWAAHVGKKEESWLRPISVHAYMKTLPPM